jgi:hypothetical protein
MNKNNFDKDNSKSYKVFTKRRKLKSPFKILQNIYANLKQKNAFSSPSFWFRNILFIFISLKLTQFYLYVRHYDIPVTKEEAHYNMILMNKTAVKAMDQKALNDYLDLLEKEKEKRKNLKNKI